MIIHRTVSFEQGVERDRLRKASNWVPPLQAAIIRRAVRGELMDADQLVRCLSELHDARQRVHASLGLRTGQQRTDGGVPLLAPDFDIAELNDSRWALFLREVDPAVALLDTAYASLT